MLTRLLLCLALLLTGCSYLQPNGASTYCTDAKGKAIHCPSIPKDSTTTDTTRKP